MIKNQIFRTILLLLTASLASCSLFSNSDREAYKASKRVKLLEEPPEIVLPERDASFDVPDVEPGAISKKANDEKVAVPADTDAKPVAPAAASSAVVPVSPGVQMHRDGQSRWLSVEVAPETLWSSLLNFWKENQTKVVESDAKLGTIKTDWAVSAAGLMEKNAGNNAFVGASNGDLVLRNQFRMRLERTQTGSNVFIYHAGAERIKSSDGSEHWKRRPTSPELEAEMITRLQQYLAQS
jgi:outer membrane protein assembly factor BamC